MAARHPWKMNVSAFQIKALFYYFKVLGVATMTLNVIVSPLDESNDHRHGWSLACSKSGIVYNACLTVFVALTNCYGAYELYLSNLANRIKFERLTDVMHEAIASATSLYILIAFCAQQRRIVAIAGRINSIGESLMMTESERAYVETASSGLKRLFLANLCAWLFVTCTYYTDVLTILLHALSVYLCNMIINSVLMQYTVILTVIRDLFHLVNAHLLEIQREIVSSSADGETRAIDAKILRFAKSFESLCESSREVSDFYSAPMLLCILKTFLSLIIILYWLCKPLVLKSSLADIVIVHTLLHGLFYLLALVALTRAASATINEISRTGRIINSCLMDNANDSTQKKLDRFSNYLTHSDVKFSVYNLFSLDQSLLISMMGSITTYLVVVLQFQEA